MSFALEEIEELFEEVQNPEAAARELLYRMRNTSPSIVGGFHVLSVERDGGSFKTPQRKAYNRAFTTLALHEQIRKRILAGERPKVGGRGRPPTRWWRVANELGIDIGQPKPATPAAEVT